VDRSFKGRGRIDLERCAKSKERGDGWDVVPFATKETVWTDIPAFCASGFLVICFSTCEGDERFLDPLPKGIAETQKIQGARP
jgi:hypothetical protein